MTQVGISEHARMTQTARSRSADTGHGGYSKHHAPAQIIRLTVMLRGHFILLPFIMSLTPKRSLIALKMKQGKIKKRVEWPTLPFVGLNLSFVSMC